MTEDLYVVAIVALLPLTACMLVFQVNPYHALVIRGILGAVAALVYALFGAADVALTEALVGTMLSITLYAVAVRSSMSMRLGVLEKPLDGMLGMSKGTPARADMQEQTCLAPLLIRDLRRILSRYHMRLELVAYPNHQAMQTALRAKDIHAVCTVSDSEPVSESHQSSLNPSPRYHLQVRIQSLYSLIESGLPPKLAKLTHISADSFGQLEANQSGISSLDAVEVQS